MTIEKENTSVIEEEISNIVVELYDNISLFQSSEDLTAVHEFIENYIKRVTRIGFRLAKSNFAALRDSCVIFHQILDTLKKEQKPISAEQLQQFEVWPTLILTYISDPDNESNIEFLINFIQDPIWDYHVDNNDITQLKDAFYRDISHKAEVSTQKDSATSLNNTLTQTTISDTVTEPAEIDDENSDDLQMGAFDGAVF